MTQERFEHGPQVEAWLKEPTFVPAADLARVSDAIARTPQRRDRSFRLPTLRFQTMFDATKAATAVAILGISGVLLATQLGPSDPGTDRAPAAAVETATSTAMPTTTTAPTAEPTPPEIIERSGSGLITLPDQLPEGATSGTIETPEGPARWVNLPSFGEELLPDGRVLPWPGGIAYRINAGRHSETSRGHLVVTANGVDWDEVPLSPPVAMSVHRGPETSVVILDDTWYVVDPRMSRMWRFDGDGSWVTIDTDAARAVAPTSWERTLSGVSRSGVVDGRSIIAIKHWFRLPRGKLDLPNSPTAMYQLDGQVYGICGGGGRDCTRNSAKRVLRFKETGKGLVVRDDRTGKRLGLLEGASASELYDGQFGAVKQWYEIQDDSLVRTTPPLGDWGDARSGPAPAPPAEGMDVFDTGSTWAAATRSYSFTSVPWLYLGGVWIEPSELGIPTGEQGAWSVAGTGNATLIWTWGDGWSNPGLRIVESPSGT